MNNPRDSSTNYQDESQWILKSSKPSKTYSKNMKKILFLMKILVGMTDKLDNSSFGLAYLLHAPAFNISALRVIRRHGTASWNYSPIH